ncbi:MAG: diguanylate cyclase [Acidobacteriota bacterium]|nr:diguanylate cyclase [Acidobacteriota bacterium]
MKDRQTKSSWKQWLRYFCIALALCFPLACMAQRYVTREYSHGLGNLNVSSIVQDHVGYLWVGTENGLYRYDGNEFKRYGANTGLPERTIESLYIGMDGTLWVGTSTGTFFLRNDDTFGKVPPPGPLSEIDQRDGTVITSIDQSTVIAATSTGLLKLRKTGQDSWFAKVLPAEGKTVWGVLSASDGSIWYGCDEQLCRIQNGKTTRLGAAQGFAEDHWISLRETANGQIWVRGNLHIGEVNPASNIYKAHDLPDASFVEPYPRLAISKHGNILTFQGSELCIWEKDHWRILTAQNGLSQFEIESIFVGRQGSVWMGVVGHGLMRWMAQDRWESYTSGNGLRDNLIWSEARDHQGRLWVAAESGLNWIAPGGTDIHRWNPTGAKGIRSGYLAIGNDGAIWVGGVERLIRINPVSLVGRSWRTAQINKLLIEKSGALWAATKSGLWKFSEDGSGEPRRIDAPVFTHPKGQFFTLARDGRGHLWTASEDGVFRLADDGWEKLDTGSTGIHPDQLAFDGSGYLWAAGPSHDLMRLRISDNRVVEAHSIRTNEILSQQVVALMSDNRGWMWVGQDAGLSVFDGSTWKSYTQEDGLVWNDVDSDAIYEDRDGSIWVGTSGGLSHLLDPGTVVKRAEVAPVFSQVTYDGKKLTDGADVKWSNATLDISMAILSFRSSHEEAVRYRLLGGVSTGWEEARDFSVRYGHLSPGNYTFEAVTVDGSGRQLSNPTVLHFRILPRWWQRTSLQVGLALITLILLAMIWWWRTRHFIDQKRQLEQAVRTRTKELETEKADLVRMREQMRHFAEHDGLSGLWNHRIIVERLKGEVERSRRDAIPLSIILADVDYFKRINDTYGHPFGDRVLREISALFQRMVRSYDWVGRYGGEEFLLVLPGTTLEQARKRADDLRLAVEAAEIYENGERVPVTISLGVASGFPRNYETMVQAADTALYQAKNGGRNMAIVAEVEGKAEYLQVR